MLGYVGKRCNQALYTMFLNNILLKINQTTGIVPRKIRDYFHSCSMSL